MDNVELESQTHHLNIEKEPTSDTPSATPDPETSRQKKAQEMEDRFGPDWLERIR